MSLRIGIIGLPNVGKSTAFNALTGAQNAEVANYPFCTIEPNKAIVPVPDERVERLANMVNVKKVIHATIEFMDIAGLVKGASEGEGLGNQFLEQIRNTEALLHIVRCFDDPNVVHVRGDPEPRSDIEVIQVELAMSDLEQIERRIEKLNKQVKGDPKRKPTLEMALKIKEHLAAGTPLSTFPSRTEPRFQALEKEMRFLTSKPMIYVANVNEDDLAEESEYGREVKSVAEQQGAEIVKMSALLEEEMIDTEEDERKELLDLVGVEESSLDKVIRSSYQVLDLISFFTFNESEARAWTVKRGATAPEAAGVIHTDFKKGFIKAEVVPFSVLEEHGSKAEAKAAGKVRMEGKDYQVQDGDVIYFRFNV